jgi:phosphatidylserine/phosphatidylglycerophosphate/cardiolipin synthase-like enzyme
MHEQLDRILQHTLKDYRVSRGEKRVLSSILDDIGADQRQLAYFRHRAFEIARQEVTGPEAHAVIGWLEDIVKVLQPDPASDPKSPRAYFSPGSACRNAIGSLLRESRKTVDICVFTITDDRITEEIVDALKRGVAIRIITDNDKAEDIGSDTLRLRNLGIPVRTDRTSNHMHHKFAIFDNATCVTGSYNWTRSAAEYNEENIVVQYDKSLIQQFRNAFDTLWESLTPDAE